MELYILFSAILFSRTESVDHPMRKNGSHSECVNIGAPVLSKESRSFYGLSFCAG